ncbi:MAG: O-antigen ligase family protein [Halanaerobium sp.]
MEIKNKVVNKIDCLIVFFIYLFSFSIFISNALINFSAIITILLVLFKLLLNKGKLNYNYYGFLLPMGLFTLSIFLSGINHWNNEILSNKFTFSFIFFFILINEIKEKGQIRKILYLLTTSAFIASIYGLYQYFYLDYSRIKSFSFSLTFGNLIAVMVIFFTIYIIWGEFSKKTKFLLLFLDILFFVNLILTKSRGAWLGFIVGLVILGFIKSKKFMIVSLIIIILLFSVLPSHYVERFKSSFDISYDLENNRSNTYRIAMWITSLKILKDYSVFGLGYYNYRTPLSEPYKLDIIKPKEGFIHVHNTYLQIAAEQGLFGLFTFLYLLYFIFKRIYNYYNNKKRGNIKLFYLGSLISIILYLVQGLTQYNFGKTEPLSLFWLIIGISFLVSSYNLNLND